MKSKQRVYCHKCKCYHLKGSGIYKEHIGRVKKKTHKVKKTPWDKRAETALDRYVNKLEWTFVDE